MKWCPADLQFVPDHSTERVTSMMIHRQIRNSASTSRSERRGALTVEFAIVAPLIFLLFVGSLELTALNFARHTAGNASYEAARKMIIPGGTAAQAQAEGVRVLAALGIGNGATVTVDDELTEVTVTVAVPAANVSWGLTRFCYGMTLQQSCTLTKE